MCLGRKKKKQVKKLHWSLYPYFMCYVLKMCFVVLQRNNGMTNNYTHSIFKVTFISTDMSVKIYFWFSSPQNFSFKLFHSTDMNSYGHFLFPWCCKQRCYCSCCVNNISLWSLSMIICCSWDNAATQQWTVWARQDLGEQMNQVREVSNKLKITCLRTIPQIHLNNYSLPEQYNHWLEIFLY